MDLPLPGFISVVAVGLVEDFLHLLLSSLCFGDLGCYASSAHLRVRHRALGLSAVDDDALAFGAELRGGIEAEVLPLDV